MVNLPIADRGGDQVQPKIVPTSDGGCYISWFDNAAGGYDVYLQRLDAAGSEIWPHNGLLLADRSFSSTEEYGLDVDTNGNALLAFRDDRYGPVVITAVKVAQDGTMLWGESGIQLTRGEEVHSPRVTGTTDGDVVVGWTNVTSVELQKLDPSGAPEWGNGVVFSDVGGAYFSLSDLHGSDAGAVIVSWVRWGPNFFDPRHLWAQKLSTSGDTQWNTPGPHVIVFDGGSLQIGNYPTFVADGSGGAVFSWYGVSPLQCYVQRILSDGTEAFSNNGVPASKNSAQVRVSPSLSFRTATEETFLFWTEENTGQSMFGLYGQKFDPSGTRQWTDNGKVLVPLGTTNLLFVRNLQYADGAMVFYLASLNYGNDLVYGTRVDGNGDFVWSDSLIQVCSLSSGKGKLAAALGTENYAILAWEDDRSGDRDVYGQNVNPDGTLGEFSGDTFDMALDCLKPYLVLPDTARFRLGVRNTSEGTIDLSGHLDVTLCDSTYLAEFLQRDVSIEAGATRVFRFPIGIPARPETCDCDLGFTIFLRDMTTLWEEGDTCTVTTTCP
jgi:hypothetical protein